MQHDSEAPNPGPKDTSRHEQTSIFTSPQETTKMSKVESIYHKVMSFLGVELHGSEPVPGEMQTDRRYPKLFTLWFSMNFNLIAVSTGFSGTYAYGLGLRDCSLVIIFFALLAAFAPAFLCTFGSKLGLRQMIVARYSFGVYGIALPILLNMATLAGYAILGSILGGQTISAIDQEHVSVNVGIVIVSLICLVVIFFGFRMMHQFDLYAWIPTLVGFLGIVGYCGKDLRMQVDAAPASAQSVLSFASLIAGFFLPWSAVSSDFTTYFDGRAKITKLMMPSYIGLWLGGAPCMILGAAIGGAVPNIPAWEDGYNSNSIGGVISVILKHSGGGGKFLLVLLAFSVLSNMIGTVYAMALNCQVLLASVSVRVPRVILTVILTAIMIPVAIKVAQDFLGSLSNFLGVISYWSAAYVAVLLVEHFVFRKRNFVNYDLTQWDQSAGLPSGIASLGAAILSFGLVVPGMDQLWFSGPFVKTTGDIGVELAFFVTAILYVPFRTLEIKLRGKV